MQMPYSASSHASSGPTLVPKTPERPQPRWVLPLLVSLTALPRLLLFFLNENYYGDAVARTDLAVRWAAHPHWISSWADGTFQFGPLQIYLVGAMLKAWSSPEDAGRLVSLFFGIGAVVPLFLLSRRLFGWKAGLWSGLAFSCWGMHLQMSTTAASESLGLFLALWVFYFVEVALSENRFGALAAAALFLNFACATRYDCWLWIPLIVVLLFLQGTDRIAGATRAILFGLMSSPFPLFWMQGNERASGDSLAPLHDIENFHRTWVQDGLSRYGQIGFRLHNLFFWPASALATLTPLVALCGIAGMIYAYRAFPHRRWLLWMAWIPTAYFTSRGAVLMTFSPLARFTVNQVVLLLPFVSYGFVRALEKTTTRQRRLAQVLVVTSALIGPVALGLIAHHPQSRVARSLEPISPVSKNPPGVIQVAHYLKDQVAAKPSADMAGTVLLDANSRYFDVLVGGFCGLSEEQLIRARWDNFKTLLKVANLKFIVLMDDGQLRSKLSLVFRGPGVEVLGRKFSEISGFFPPFHVYRAEP